VMGAGKRVWNGTGVLLPRTSARPCGGRAIAGRLHCC